MDGGEERVLEFGVESVTESSLRADEARLFGRYGAILRHLRGPEGCPWDRKQTLASLRQYIVEEAFELVAAIDDAAAGSPDGARVGPTDNTVGDGGYAEVADELGDLVLVTLLTADALELASGLTFADVLAASGQKLVRRHPHVFGDVVAETPEAVVRSWNAIKEHVEGRSTSVEAVGRGLPPLDRAFEMQKKAAKRGFDWPGVEPVFAKVEEELQELRDAFAEEDPTAIESELGDLLFSVVNVARHVRANPTLALAGVNERFSRRFSWVCAQCEERGIVMDDADIAVLDAIWDEAKAQGL